MRAMRVPMTAITVVRVLFLKLCEDPLGKGLGGGGVNPGICGAPSSAELIDLLPSVC